MASWDELEEVKPNSAWDELEEVPQQEKSNFAKDLGKGLLQGVSSLGVGIGKNVVNPLREKVGKEPLTDYEIENVYGKVLGKPVTSKSGKTGKVIGEILPYMLLPNIAPLGTATVGAKIGNLALSGGYQGALGGGLSSVANKGFSSENIKDALVGGVAGASLGLGIGAAGEKLARVSRAKKIKARKEMPLEQRMTPQQLEQATKPKVKYYPAIYHEPSTFGTANINTTANKQLANQIQSNIKAEKDLLNEYKGLRSQMTKKYGSLKNLQEQAKKDFADPNVSQYGNYSEAVKDYRNIIEYENTMKDFRYVDNTYNSTVLNPSQRGVKQYSKAIKQTAEESIEKPQVTQEVVEEIPTQQITNEVIDETINSLPTGTKATTPLTSGIQKQRASYETLSKEVGDKVNLEDYDKLYDVRTRELVNAEFEAMPLENKVELETLPIAELKKRGYRGDLVNMVKQSQLATAIQKGEQPSIAMLNDRARNLTETAQELASARTLNFEEPLDSYTYFTKLTRETAPKEAVKLIDDVDNVIKEVQKSNVDIQKAFDEWLIKLDQPKTRKQLSEKGDQLALMKAMEKFRRSETKKIGRLEEQRLKKIETMLAKKGVKPRERKGLITKLIDLDNLGGLTPENATQLINKQYKIPELNAEDTSKIAEFSQKIQSSTGREQNKNIELLKKYLAKKFPIDWKDRDQTYRTINMLLSPKSRSKDVLGSILWQGERFLDEQFAKLPALLPKSRAMQTRDVSWKGLQQDISDWGRGAKRGFQEGAEDVGLGISTSRSGDGTRFDLTKQPVFEGVPVMQQLEKGLNYAIRVPDRTFYEAAYEASIGNQMRAMGLTQPTEEIIQQAQQEALQAVFQNESILSKTGLKIRDLLNFEGVPILENLRLGQRNIPFLQTIANLATEGIKSTVGLPTGLYQYAKATTPAQLRNAELMIGKGLKGASLYGTGGYLLAQNPENTNIGELGRQSYYGDDVTGMPVQGVRVGDKAFSLSSFPQATIPLSIYRQFFEDGTPIQKMARAGIQTGSILADLPAFKGVGDLVKGGADIGKAINKQSIGEDGAVDEAVSNVARQYLSNQIGQYVPLGGALGSIRNAIDPIRRELYTENTPQYIGNRIINRLPFASQTLPKKYNVIGEPSLQTNIQNTAGRVIGELIDPLSIRNYNEAPKYLKDLEDFQDVAMQYDLAGKTNIKMQPAKRYIGRGKNRINLNNEQYSEFSRVLNSNIATRMEWLSQQPYFLNMPANKQTKEISKIKNSTRKEAERYIMQFIGNQ